MPTSSSFRSTTSNHRNSDNENVDEREELQIVKTTTNTETVTNDIPPKSSVVATTSTIETENNNSNKFPSSSWVPIVALVTLAFQNVLSVMLTHHVESRSGRKNKFSVAMANVLTEITKFCICSTGLVFFWENPSNNNNNKTNSSSFAKPSFKRIFEAFQTRSAMAMTFIALIYAVENNVYFIALRNLSSQVFQVVYQMKLVVTATLLYFLLGRRLSSTKWIALFVIVFGIILTERQQRKNQKNLSDIMYFGSSDNNNTKTSTTTTSIPNQQLAVNPVQQNPTIGMLAVVTCALCSAFACAYFETVIKKKQQQTIQLQQRDDDDDSEEHQQLIEEALRKDQSLLVRNVQLSGFSIITNSILFLISADSANVHDPLRGFDSMVYLLVLIQAFGGLLVSIIIKYCDSVVKGIATAVAIVLNGIFSMMFLGFQPSLTFLIGACVVVVGTIMYAMSK